MKKIVYIIGLVVIAAAIVFIGLNCSGGKTNEDIFEDTPINVQSVDLKGELYVYSEILEDFMVEKKGEQRFLNLMNKDHVRVVVRSWRVSYVLDLEKVQTSYDDKTVTVKLPEIEIKKSEQPISNGKAYICDDDDFWDKQPDNLVAKLQQKVEKRFDSLEKKQTANQRAKDFVKMLFESAGFAVVFADENAS